MKLDNAVGGSHTLARPVINSKTWQTFQIMRWERIINSEGKKKICRTGVWNFRQLGRTKKRDVKKKLGKSKVVANGKDWLGLNKMLLIFMLRLNLYVFLL
jgi:hypothetical protein